MFSLIRLSLSPRFALACVLCLLGSHGVIADTVDFRNDLIPVLTKSGCNAGACHGAALGRGGFKLSLYGGNPKLDYDAIVRQLNGRRINLANPVDSLVFLKPTQGIEHEGGLIFDEDSPAANLIANWIKQGAANESERQLERIDVQPKTKVLDAVGQRVRFQTTALYSDGTSRDVTEWTIFSAEDDSAIEIDSSSNTAVASRRGRHVVVARYLDQVVPIELLVPLSDEPIAKSVSSTSNFIDQCIQRSLFRLRLPSSGDIDDAAFLRRVTLDLAGRLPTIEEFEKVVSSKQESSILRSAIVDRLLESNEFVDYWSLKLATWLRIKPTGPRATATDASLLAYHGWLKEQVRKGTPFDQMARTLILATGDTTEFGPANFYRTGSDPRKQAEFVSELFMGSRLRCANCHNHPLDRWTQDDYHGLAAIFAKVDVGRVVKRKPKGEVIHPATLEPAIPRIPGQRFLKGDSEVQEALADWLTDSSNPYFAKAMVNRFWKSMMGRGLVEPADDFRATNPATHPDLLDQLANDFQENGYDIRRTLRLIVSSEAYSRSSATTATNRDDQQFYSHAIWRPLDAEVLADAISDVLGVPESYAGTPSGTRAVTLVNPRTPSRTLDVLGRCGREESCESAPAGVGGLPQKLHLMNGALLNSRIAADESRLSKQLGMKQSLEQIIQHFYVVAYSRKPNAREMDYWKTAIARLADEQRQEFMEDFVWGLTTSREFSTNH